MPSTNAQFMECARDVARHPVLAACAVTMWVVSALMSTLGVIYANQAPGNAFTGEGSDGSTMVTMYLGLGGLLVCLVTGCTVYCYVRPDPREEGQVQLSSPAV